MVLFKIFNRRWWWTTLIVIAGVVVLIRLGFWQLDRLDQRRDFNTTVAARWNETPFDLNQNPLPSVLDDLEYRRIQVDGEFDYTNQILLTQQTRDGVPGVVLVTPFVYASNDTIGGETQSGENTQAILVARGWIPSNQATPENWSQFEEPPGSPVIGLIQESQLLPSGAAPTIPAEPQTEWFWLNIDAVQPQMPYTLAPVFIYQLPEEGRPANALPYRTEPMALDEGSHFSYAIQWFMFAIILGGGYFFFINHMESREQRIAAQNVEQNAQTDETSSAQHMTDQHISREEKTSTQANQPATLETKPQTGVEHAQKGHA